MRVTTRKMYLLNVMVIFLLLGACGQSQSQTSGSAGKPVDQSTQPALSDVAPAASSPSTQPTVDMRGAAKDAGELLFALHLLVANYARQSAPGNEFKREAAGKQFDEALDALRQAWVGREVQVELTVAEVTKTHVVAVQSAEGPDKEPPVTRIIVGRPPDSNISLGEVLFTVPGALVDLISLPTTNTRICGWAWIGQDVQLEAVRKWNPGQRYTATIEVLAIKKLLASDSGQLEITEPGLPLPEHLPENLRRVAVAMGVHANMRGQVVVLARWSTSQHTFLDQLDQARTTSDVNRQRIARVGQVASAVRAWREQMVVAPTNALAPFLSDAAAGKLPEVKRVLEAEANRLFDGDTGPCSPACPDFQLRDGRGWSALHHAAFAGHEAVVRALIEQVNPGDHTGDNHMTGRGMYHAVDDPRTQRLVTPMHLAAMEGHAACLALLLPQNVPAHTSWRDNRHRVFRHASADKFLRGENPFKSPGMPEQTAETWAPELAQPDGLPARPEPIDIHRQYPLNFRQPISAVLYTINEPDIDGLTPLDYARIFKRDAVIKLLVEAGAKGLLDPADLEKSAP